MSWREYPKQIEKLALDYICEGNKLEKIFVSKSMYDVIDVDIYGTRPIKLKDLGLKHRELGFQYSHNDYAEIVVEPTLRFNQIVLVGSGGVRVIDIAIVRENKESGGVNVANTQFTNDELQLIFGLALHRRDILEDRGKRKGLSAPEVREMTRVNKLVDKMVENKMHVKENFKFRVFKHL